MSRIKLALLSVVAVFAISAVGASAASAAVEFEWHVGAAKLAGSKNVKTSGTSYKLKGTVGETAVTIECAKQGEEGVGTITGGLPGKDKGTTTFTECKIAGLAVCTVKVKPAKVKTELVKVVVGGVEEVADLFEPETGTEFTTIEITGASCAIKGNRKVEGSVIARLTPQKAIGPVGTLTFPATAIINYTNSAGTAKTAGLTFAGNAATLEGSSKSELESKEEFGAF